MEETSGEEECNDDNTVKEQEEEEVDMDLSIAACLEDNRLFKECGVAVDWQNE